MEDNIIWKTTFDRRRPLVYDYFQWKMTLGGRQPSVEDDLWLKTTCSGRRLSTEEDLCWILACCLLRFASFFHTERNFSVSYRSIFFLQHFINFVFDSLSYSVCDK